LALAFAAFSMAANCSSTSVLSMSRVLVRDLRLLLRCVFLVFLLSVACSGDRPRLVGGCRLVSLPCLRGLSSIVLGPQWLRALLLFSSIPHRF